MHHLLPSDNKQHDVERLLIWKQLTVLIKLATEKLENY